MATTRIVISGFASCPYYQGAVTYAKNLPKTVSVRVVELSRDDFHTFRVNTLQSMGKPAEFHKTCPFVFTENAEQQADRVIGGFDALRATSF